MKALLLATILSALRAYVGGGLFTRIQTLVVSLTEVETITGGEKMALVVEGAKREVATLSETLIRAVAEVVLLKIKAP